MRLQLNRTMEPGKVGNDYRNRAGACVLTKILLIRSMQLIIIRYCTLHNLLCVCGLLLPHFPIYLALIISCFFYYYYKPN